VLCSPLALLATRSARCSVPSARPRGRLLAAPQLGRALGCSSLATHLLDRHSTAGLDWYASTALGGPACASTLTPLICRCLSFGCDENALFVVLIVMEGGSVRDNGKEPCIGESSSDVACEWVVTTDGNAF
jgi:hypothetical protein